MRQTLNAPVLWILVFWLLSLGAPAAPAGEGALLDLMRPDSLAGWEHGARPAAGWSIAGGELRGDTDSTPLVSGFTFGEFTLRWEWRVEGKAEWEILLPEVPSGPGLRLALREGEGCGRLDDGTKLLVPGIPLTHTDGAWHTAELRRTGDRIELAIDGKPPAWNTQLAAGRRFGLGLAVVGSKAQLRRLRVEEPRGRPLPCGKDLAGWWTPGDRSAWTAENGAIFIRKEGGNYLRTEKEYANFTLSLDYIIQKGGNSGIGIRTPRLGWPSGDGMEIQIWDVPYDRPLDKHAAGGIYGNVPPLGRNDRSGEFNHLAIKADGPMISAWMNGQLVQQYNTALHPELKHRHLKGWIGIQDHGAQVEVRNLRVLEAPPGMGLDAWRRPQPASAAAAVIDRLMNSERLSSPEEVHSATVRTRVDGGKSDGHVLADLAGPGAVVRLARTSDDGRLQFFFDGQEKPAIECKPTELWQTAPQLAEDPNPVFTCLAFRKSLKIVLQGARRGDWRIDYLTSPGGAGESYTAKDDRIPRGWLAAAIYRHEQFGWGVHREEDPWPRLNSGPRTLAPGNRETLIRSEGAGIVHWIKLVADKHVLTNNDLWLEVRVNGRQQPAVATPVRFWFPGLAGDGNYPNYVLVDRGGATNMLAMPFAAGIELALVNRGNKPLAGVGLTAAVEPATEKTRAPIEGRRSLCAVFEPAGTADRTLAQRESPGRWIGLVYEEPKGIATAIDFLLIDGRAAAGWKTVAFDEFLGRSGDFRSCSSGRRGPLAWRYLLAEAVEFQQSFRLTAAGPSVGNRLAVFYAQR